MWLGFSASICDASDGATATNKVHDDSDDREQDQQVDEKAADVEDQETSKPKNQENHCEDEEHGNLLSDVRNRGCPRKCRLK